MLLVAEVAFEKRDETSVMNFVVAKYSGLKTPALVSPAH
jgi:hypothetical protein